VRNVFSSCEHGVRVEVFGILGGLINLSELLVPQEPDHLVLVYDLFVYDVSRDGQRFLINTQVKQAESVPMF
jgi:hypothetical protein